MTTHGHTALPGDAPSTPPSIDPRALLVFRQVGIAGSLSGAAGALGWTAPAVSAHVRSLERVLGVPLAARRGRGIEITPAGRALLTHADAVAASLADAEREMAEHARARAGVVRVAAFPSATATLLARAASELARDAPDLDLRLEQREPPEALAGLAAGEFDIAIVFAYGGEGRDESAYERTSLLDDHLFAILPAGHPLAEAPGLRIGDLASERWISGCPDCRRHLLGRAAAQGFVPDVRHSTDDYVVVQSLVASGMGVAVLPGLALAASIRPDITARPLAEAPRGVSALTRRSTASIPAVRATVSALERAARVHVQSASTR